MAARSSEAKQTSTQGKGMNHKREFLAVARAHAQGKLAESILAFKFASQRLILASSNPRLPTHTRSRAVYTYIYVPALLYVGFFLDLPFAYGVLAIFASTTHVCSLSLFILL